MGDYISRKAAIAYIREQSEECHKAFEELGGESGIYADAYNDLTEMTTLNVERPASCESALRGQQHQPID